MVTKAEFLFMIQSVMTYHPVHMPSHPVHTAAHCNPLQPAANHPVYIQCTHTAVVITSSVHTAANLQCTLQPIFSAHCSHVQPCTTICSQLQPSTTIYTAAILSSAHCSYTIQCTLQLHYLYSVSSSPLDHHRVSLYHYWPTSRAVSRH